MTMIGDLDHAFKKMIRMYIFGGDFYLLVMRVSSDSDYTHVQ